MAHPIVDGPIGTNVPAILNIEAVNIVECLHKSRARRNHKLSRGAGRSETLPFAEVELLEERVIRKVADAKAGLDGMRPVSPGEVIEILETVLETALRAAECGTMIEVRPLWPGIVERSGVAARNRCQKRRASLTVCGVGVETTATFKLLS